MSKKMTIKETRDMFSARFDKYENGPVKAIRLKEVRTRFGGEVKPTLTFKEAEVVRWPNLSRLKIRNH